jgi:hypothetical protein
MLLLHALLMHGLSGDDGRMPTVSKLDAVLGAQAFQLQVAPGGAAVLVASGGGGAAAAAEGEVLSTVTSSFSSPGPRWLNFSHDAADAGWNVTVDSSQASKGVWTVTGTGSHAAAFRVVRTYSLDPRPPALPRRVLVNDTLTAMTAAAAAAAGEGHDQGHAAAAAATSAPPSVADVIGVHVKHTATVAPTEAEVDQAVVPGTYGNWQCGTDGNPGDDCAAPCFDRNVLMTNCGRPDVFANTSSGKFAVGMVALDDVFRVHAQTHQRAMRVGPRMASMGMSCEVTSPPSIELADPMLALLRNGDSYRQEWAIYPLTNATDYYAFVNAQRSDSGVNRIRIPQTGFLGPGDSEHADTTLYNNTGWSTCWNQSAPWNAQTKLKNAKTCWEHYSPELFLSYIQTQGGPGGTLQIDNEDM